MVIKYGFELEGFVIDKLYGNVLLPTLSHPLDGFPGLVELRTKGGNSLEEAYSEIVKKYLYLPDNEYSFVKSEHKFSGEDMAKLRKSFSFEKRNIDILNIYGKSPRRSGNKTLASLQINISNQITSGYTNDKNIYIPPTYGLLDIYNIVKNLDTEFDKEIKRSNRQPGMYAIKDSIRLEYRSLPNFVWSFGVRSGEGNTFLSRIRKCVEKTNDD